MNGKEKIRESYFHLLSSVVSDDLHKNMLNWALVKLMGHEKGTLKKTEEVFWRYFFSNGNSGCQGGVKTNGG